VAAAKRRVEASPARSPGPKRRYPIPISHLPGCTLRQQIQQQQSDIASSAADAQKARAELDEAKENGET